MVQPAEAGPVSRNTRQGAADKGPDDPGDQELLGNYLVVLAENVFKQPMLVVMVMIVLMLIMCGMHISL